MTADELKLELSRPELLAELHHLFWMKPFVNLGKTDYGWSCRDHALTLGLIAKMRGFEVKLVSGAASFIQGPEQGRAPFGITMDQHAWVQVEGSGTYDFSLKLATMRGLPRWRDWQVDSLLASKLVPPGRAGYGLTSDKHTFENATNAATNVEGQRFAIYWRQAIEQISASHVSQACSWVNSPLTDKIRKLGPDIYAKAALHLMGLLDCSAEPLIHESQSGAWEKLSQGYGDAILQVGRACGWGVSVEDTAGSEHGNRV